MRQNMRGIGTGTISLVLIFAVLCLTIFAVLTLSTANAEKTLVTRSASFVASYYEADFQATRIKAHIIHAHRGENFTYALNDIASAFNTQIYHEQLRGGSSQITFASKVNDFHNLSVKLMLAENQVSVLEWRVVYSRPWEFDDTIPVWDGMFYR